MKILLLEDHQLFATGLCKLLLDHFPTINIVTLHSVNDVVATAPWLASFDMMISDIEIPNEDVLELLESITDCAEQLPILVLSMHNKLPVIIRCQKLGVRGYMLKDDNEIVKAIELISSGGQYYSPKISETLSIVDDPTSMLLSPREEEIMKCVAQGKNNAEMAEILYISPSTVATHRKNINRKLQLTSPSEVTRYYYENYIP